MLVVETDEEGHSDRDLNYKKKRKIDLEKVGCHFIRIIPDKKHFNDYEELGRVNA